MREKDDSISLAKTCPIFMHFTFSIWGHIYGTFNFTFLMLESLIILVGLLLVLARTTVLRYWYFLSGLQIGLYSVSNSLK